MEGSRPDEKNSVISENSEPLCNSLMPKSVDSENVHGPVSSHLETRQFSSFASDTPQSQQSGHFSKLQSAEDPSFDASMQAEILANLPIVNRWELALRLNNFDFIATFQELLVIGMTDQDQQWTVEKIKELHSANSSRLPKDCSLKTMAENEVRANSDFSLSEHDISGTESSVDDIPANQAPAIPGFRLGRRLGAGGYGIVFEAWQENCETETAPYAIKLLHPGMLYDDRVLHRFEREAQAVASIPSQYIVSPIKVDLKSVQPFIAMHRALRGSLGDEIRRRRERVTSVEQFSAAEILQYAKDMLRAATAAHSAGVIHRDIKPSNLLISNEGHLMLTDFGLATSTDDRDLTASDQVMGTIAYAAPEQLTDAKGVDDRADQFAIGSTIYQLATDTLPYPSKTALGKLNRVRKSKPPPPSLSHSKLDSRFDAIVMRMIEPSAESRFPNCSLALAAIEDYEKGLKPRFLCRAMDYCRRLRWFIRVRPIVSSAGLITAVLLFAGIAILAYQNSIGILNLTNANRHNAELAARIVDIKAAAKSRLDEQEMAAEREFVRIKMSSIAAGEYATPVVDYHLANRIACSSTNDSSAKLYSQAIERLLSNPPVTVDRNETRPRFLPTAIAGSDDGFIATATHSGAVYLCSDTHPGFSRTLEPGRLVHGQSPLSFHGPEYPGQPPSQRSDHFYTTLSWDSSWTNHVRKLKEPEKNLSTLEAYSIPIRRADDPTCNPAGKLFAGTLKGVIRQWQHSTGWRDIARFKNDSEGPQSISHLKWLDHSLLVVARSGKIVRLSNEKIEAADLTPILLDDAEIVYDCQEEIADIEFRKLPTATDGVFTNGPTEWIGCIATCSGRVFVIEDKWQATKSFDLKSQIYDIDIHLYQVDQQLGHQDTPSYTVAIGSSIGLPLVWPSNQTKPERLSNRFAMSDISPIEAISFNAAGDQLLTVDRSSKFTRWDLNDLYSREKFSFASSFLTHFRTLPEPDLSRRLPRSSFLTAYLIPHHNAWIVSDTWKRLAWLSVPGQTQLLDPGFSTIPPSDIASVTIEGRELLIVGGSNGMLQAVVVKTGEIFATQFASPVVSVVVHDSSVIVALKDGTLARVNFQLRDSAGGKIQLVIGSNPIVQHLSTLIDVDMDQVHARIFCLSEDLLITVYDVNSGQKIFAGKIFGSEVAPETKTTSGAIAVSPNGNRVAIVCDQQVAAAFDLENKKPIDLNFDLVNSKSTAAIWWNDNCVSYDHGSSSYCTSVMESTKDFQTRLNAPGRSSEFTKVPKVNSGLVWFSQSALGVVDLASGRLSAVFPMPTEFANSQICASPDGRNIWIVASTGKIQRLKLPLVDEPTLPERKWKATQIGEGEKVFCHSSLMHPDSNRVQLLVANSLRSDQYANAEMKLVTVDTTGIQSESLEVTGLPKFAGKSISNRKFDSASTKIYLDRDQNPLVVTRIARPDGDQSSFSMHLGHKRESGKWDWTQVTKLENFGYAPIITPTAQQMKESRSVQDVFNYEYPNFDILHCDQWFNRACRNYMEDESWRMTTHLDMGLISSGQHFRDASWLTAGEYRGGSATFSSVLRWDENSGQYQPTWLGHLGVCYAKLVDSHPSQALVAVDFHNQRRPATLLRFTADRIDHVMNLPFGIQCVKLDDESYVGVEAAIGVETQVHLYRYTDKTGWISNIIYRGQPTQQASVNIVTNGKSFGIVVNLTTAESSACYYLHPDVKPAP